MDTSGTPWGTYDGPPVRGWTHMGLPGSDIVIDVPAGIRIELSGPVRVIRTRGLAASLTVWGNGSSLLLDIGDLSEIQRRLVSTSDGPDMNTILDQILDSARRLTAPLTPTPSATSQ